MKKLTAIFIIYVFSSFSQQNDEWITPFSTVEFKGGKIIYYFADADPVLRLTRLEQIQHKKCRNSQKVVSLGVILNHKKLIISICAFDK